MKNKSLIGVLVVLVFAIIIALGYTSIYNKLIRLEEDVNNAYSNIEVNLERRADLIPNLVSTVKGYTSHEQEVLDKITSARENLLKADNVKDKEKANNELSSAIDALLVIVENYPDLKANTNFISLQDELAGTENRIAVSRKDYNEAVTSYNKAIKTIPNNFVASISGFDKKDYFETDDTKKEVPEVSFE